MPFRVHIVAADDEVRAATADLLSRHGFRIRAYAGPEEVLREPELGRACLVLSLGLPERGALGLLEALAARGVELPAIALGCPGDVDTAVRAMKLGAIDFLELPLREGPLFAALGRAQDMVRRGRDRGFAKRSAVTRIERLSPRERQILRGLAAGLSNKAIARLLGLSPRTVEMHRASMMADLGISSLPEAVRLAVDAELPPLTEEPEEPVAPAASGLDTTPESLARELVEPLSAISDFARGLQERLADRSLSDEALRAALSAVEESAQLAVEIAGRISRQALEER